MFVLQHIILAVYAAFVLTLVGMSIASHLKFARGRSRSQRTMTESEIDCAVDALSHPDENRRDERPLRKRRHGVWWTTLGGTHFRAVTRRED